MKTHPLLMTACFQFYLPSIIFFIIILLQTYAFDILRVWDRAELAYWASRVSSTNIFVITS